MPAPKSPGRIQFIDVARFGAMALVFYGHFIERIMYLKNPTAAAQYKFIYSFHMVLFFVLAGYVVKESDLLLGLGRFLKHRLLSRLLPFAFFTLLFMIAAAIFPGDFLKLKLPTVQGYTDGLVNTIFGIPMFCVPSWFLLIIFSVEVVHFVVSRFLKTDTAVVIGIILFYAGGYLFNWQFDIVNPMKGRVIGWNYLFIHEAIFMYAFYLMGVYLRRKAFLQGKGSPVVMLPHGRGHVPYRLIHLSFKHRPFQFHALRCRCDSLLFPWPYRLVPAHRRGRLVDDAVPCPGRARLAADRMDGAQHPDSHVPQRHLLPLHQSTHRQMGRQSISPGRPRSSWRQAAP